MDFRYEPVIGNSVRYIALTDKALQLVREYEPIENYIVLDRQHAAEWCALMVERKLSWSY